MLDRWLAMFWSAVDDASSVVSDPGERAYWPFLVASLFIVVVAHFLARPAAGAGPLRSLLSPSIWLHRSARLDYQLILAKAVIRALLFAPILVSALAIAAWVVGALTDRFGLVEAPALARYQISLLYTVVLFVAWDLSRYALHRLFHEVPALWELHKVHHSAEVLTPFTVYRVHPIESALYSLRGAVVTGIVTGCFFYLFRTRAVQYDLLGVNALGMLFNLAGANLRHSQVWLSFGRAVEHVVISPAQHQLHHSRARAHLGRNYGSCLAIWDWLGGSLMIAGARQQLHYGLAPADRNHDPQRLGSALIQPMLFSVRQLLPKARVSSRARGAHESPTT